MADTNRLQRELGISFSNISLLERALTHESYVNENSGLAPESNERLEFLGDAVLSLIVADELFSKRSEMTEGQLTKQRAAIVRGESLAHVAEKIKLGGYLLLGKGEEAGGGRHKQTNLAAALEAVIAAAYLDKGLEEARSLILRLFSGDLADAALSSVAADYKSALQQYAQKHSTETPTYVIISTTGPAHNKTFTVDVRLGGKILGNGTGKNKKMAENEAARQALHRLSLPL